MKLLVLIGLPFRAAIALAILPIMALSSLITLFCFVVVEGSAVCVPSLDDYKPLFRWVVKP